MKLYELFGKKSRNIVKTHQTTFRKRFVGVGAAAVRKSTYAAGRRLPRSTLREASRQSFRKSPKAADYNDPPGAAPLLLRVFATLA